MKRKPKNPAKRAPMPEGYDGAKTKKQQGSLALQGKGWVHFSINTIVGLSSIIIHHVKTMPGGWKLLYTDLRFRSGKVR